MKHRASFHVFLALMLAAASLSGCSQSIFNSPLVEPPHIADDTAIGKQLKSLPPARVKTVVAAYDFQDQTGQLKANTTFAEYSKAVTQGSLAILNKALLEAGNGTWFTVTERGGLKDLLQERQIINMMRGQYPGPDGQKLNALPPLLYAGMLIEGGVVGYDSNVVTGGAGANYLGVNGNVTYQRDIATVELRAVNIATGEVLLSVTAEKTIYSTAVQGSVFKYVSFDHLLQAETGFTTNEPPQLAVRKAIETAVYSLVMEGALKGYWQFADPVAGQVALSDYVQRTADNQNVPPATVAGKNVQLQQTDPAATSPQPTNPNEAKVEKKSIFGGIADFLSTDDVKNSGSTPSQDPVYPSRRSIVLTNQDYFTGEKLVGNASNRTPARDRALPYFKGAGSNQQCWKRQDYFAGEGLVGNAGIEPATR